MAIRFFRYNFLLLATAAIAFLGCSRNNRLEALSDISDYVADNPHSALEALDSIDYASLSTPDRHFYDFLSIKANDKAYITHTSDSLILDVIDYYSHQGDEGMCAEALYYGGRVYSDMGDYPSALKYYQKALDRLPSTEKFLNLKFRLLSQTGRLLNILRLYDESEKYLKQALETERRLNDTIAEVNDLCLIGHTLTQAGKFAEADCYLKEAIEKSRNMSSSIKVKSSLDLASLKYKTGQIDSALILIRGIPDSVNHVSRSTALAHAAKIYLKAGILDTAFMYARELVLAEDSNNKQSGYWVLLSPELRAFSDSKTIEQYVNEYSSTLEDLLNFNSKQLAVLQQASYNYNKHLENKEKAERRSHRLSIVIVLLIIIILILVVIYLYKQNRYRSTIIKLQNMSRNLDLIKDNLTAKSQDVECANSNVNMADATVIPNEEDLIEELKAKLMDIAAHPELDNPVPEEIIESDAYKKILDHLKSGRQIDDSDSVWDEIEAIVVKSSPKFRVNITRLFGVKLYDWEQHTILLIKCGFAPSQLAILQGRAKSTITSRRNSIGAKILNGSFGLKDVDRVIRAL